MLKSKPGVATTIKKTSAGHNVGGVEMKATKAPAGKYQRHRTDNSKVHFRPANEKGEIGKVNETMHWDDVHDDVRKHFLKTGDSVTQTPGLKDTLYKK